MTTSLPTIGNYQLLEELASGAFGRVYRARHLYLTNRIAAVKLLHTHISSEKERQSFLKEASFLEMLKHPHILPIFDVGIHDGFPYIITEFADGGSLRQRLQRTAPKLLPLEMVIKIVTQVAEALHTAHQQQVVHRDLKPENILFRADGSALLADFGISTVLSSMSVQQATIIGTPLYMAPEQFKGIVSKEGDQYALGCIAYELVTGHQPFTASDFFSMGFKHMEEQPVSPQHFIPSLPEHISQAILKALAKDRQQRYPEVMLLAEALTSVAISPQPLATTNLDTRPPLPGTNLATLNPYSASSCREWGDAFYNLQRYEDALEAYEKVIKLDPTCVYAYNGKGLALEALGDYAGALEAYEEAIQLDPGYASAYRNKGDTLRGLNRYEEALEAYEEAIKLDPKNENVYNGKGNTLYDLQRYTEALEAYNQAIGLDPKYAIAYANKSMVLYDLKRYEEGLEAANQATRFKSPYTNPHNSKGRTLEVPGSYEGALEMLEEDDQS